MKVDAAGWEKSETFDRKAIRNAQTVFTYSMCGWTGESVYAVNFLPNLEHLSTHQIQSWKPEGSTWEKYIPKHSHGSPKPQATQMELKPIRNALLPLKDKKTRGAFWGSPPEPNVRTDRARRTWTDHRLSNSMVHPLNSERHTWRGHWEEKAHYCKWYDVTYCFPKLKDANIK